MATCFAYQCKLPISEPLAGNVAVRYASAHWARPPQYKTSAMDGGWREENSVYDYQAGRDNSGCFAGLSAAYRLMKQGMTPVLIEAQEGAGGRGKGKAVDRFSLDMGVIVCIGTY